MLDIIIVDDEKDAIDLLKILIEKHGHVRVVRTFDKVSEFLVWIKTNSVDAIFLDINMPVMRGTEVAKEINKVMNAKIIFTTAYREFAVEAFEVRAFDYIVKPINRKRLNEVLDRILEDSKIQTKKSKIEVNLFGSVEVKYEDSYISFRTKKAYELFAFIVIRGRVSKDTIIDNLFDGYDIESAINSIYSLVSSIRKAFKDVGIDIKLVLKNNYYEINLENVACDYLYFKEIAEYLEVTKENEREFLTAIKSCKSDFLMNNGYAWSVTEAALLRHQYDDMVNRLLIFYESLGEVDKMINVLMLAFEIDKADENSSLNLIELLVRHNKIEKAKIIYEAHKKACESLGTSMNDKIKKYEKLIL